MKNLELNEYITNFNEIKPKLDELSEDLIINEVVINNNGCSNAILNKTVKYLKNLGFQVTIESKGVATLNRLYGIK